MQQLIKGAAVHEYSHGHANAPPKTGYCKGPCIIIVADGRMKSSVSGLTTNDVKGMRTELRLHSEDCSDVVIMYFHRKRCLVEDVAVLLGNRIVTLTIRR